MKGTVFKYSPLSILILAVSCATVAEYSPVVDPASITDQSKYAADARACRQLTDQVDYSDEEAIAALAGGAIGGAAVVGATAVALGTTGGFSALAAGATLAPIVWPLLRSLQRNHDTVDQYVTSGWPFEL